MAPHRLLHGQLRPARPPHQHHLAVRVRDAQRVRREDHARQTCVAMPSPLESAYLGFLRMSNIVDMSEARHLGDAEHDGVPDGGGGGAAAHRQDLHHQYVATDSNQTTSDLTFLHLCYSHFSEKVPCTLALAQHT